MTPTDADDPTAVLINKTPPPMSGRRIAIDELTVRDLFAMAALQGVLARHSGETALPDHQEAARWSREYADALLTELVDRPYGE